MTAPLANAAGVQDTEGSFFIEFWRHRRLLARLTVLSAVVAGLAMVYLPPTWTSRGSFVVLDSGADAMQSLSGISSRFGIDLPSSSGGYAPRFFAALMLSREVLGVVADRKVSIGDDTEPRTVAEILAVRGRSLEAKREHAISYLRVNVVGAMFDQRTGITSFTVKTKSARLSDAIAQALVVEANRFAAERHQSRATVERRFVEARRSAIERELTAAEDAVVAFLRQNRSYQQSPEQTVEFSRLSRRVSELQSVQSLLSQTFEQARIEEVRDSPLLSPVETPQLPVVPDNRSALGWIGGSMLLALLLALGVITLGRLLGLSPPWREGEPRGAAEAWPTLRSELVRPWRLVF